MYIEAAADELIVRRTQPISSAWPSGWSPWLVVCAVAFLPAVIY
jgi:hypothetical protein